MARPNRPTSRRPDGGLPSGARLSFKAPDTRAAPPRRAVVAAPAGPMTVPTRWLKMIAAVLLLPVCWVASKTFFEEFTLAGLRHHFWTTEEFYFFALGGLLWLIAFFGLPRPLVIYVFGHELTHALWVWVQGGEVSEFRVGRDGGYIIADRRDFFVSLAPYFFPLYSIAAIAVYWGASQFYPEAWLYHRWLYAVLGATWAFHFSFTCWMIPKQQTDLLLHGTFFSLVVIYLANLAVLTVLLLVACPQLHWGGHDGFGHRLLVNAEDVSAWLCEQAGVRPTQWWR